MRNAVKAILTGDATLMALLTGGVHAATEISRQNTPAAFDANSELKPCALLKLEAARATPPHDAGVRQLLALYVYQRDGFTVIDTAVDRVFALLNGTPIASVGVYELRHVDDSPDMQDTGIDAALRIARYEAVRLR